MNIKRKFLTGFILATAVLYVPANIANAQIGDFPGGANNAAAELFSRTVDGKIHAVIRVKIDRDRKSGV